MTTPTIPMADAPVPEKVVRDTAITGTTTAADLPVLTVHADNSKLMLKLSVIIHVKRVRSILIRMVLNRLFRLTGMIWLPLVSRLLRNIQLLS